MHRFTHCRAPLATLTIAGTIALGLGLLAALFTWCRAVSQGAIRGRAADGGDGPVVILNEAVAKILFPGRSAVSGRFTVATNPDQRDLPWTR